MASVRIVEADKTTVDWEYFVSSKVSKEKFLKGFDFINLSIIQI